MAKKSQIRARRNNTQIGQSVVNLYNHGTVNIDVRQNNSVPYKHDNRGTKIYYPNRPCTHRLGDSMPEILKTEGVSNMQPVKPPDSKAMSKLTKILIGAAIAAIATGAVLMLAKSN